MHLIKKHKDYTYTYMEVQLDEKKMPLTVAAFHGRALWYGISGLNNRSLKDHTNRS